MSVISERPGVNPGTTTRLSDTPDRRLSTETKAAFKTTEFVAYVAVLVGIFVAGAVTKAGTHHPDVFSGHQVWLFATILTIGYMVSRGLAKAGAKQFYDER